MPENLFSCGYPEDDRAEAKFRHFSESQSCGADMRFRMLRTVWFALICLISLGVLLTLRSNIGARPLFSETAPLLAASSDLTIDDRPPLVKSDRLPSSYFNKPAAKSAGTVQNISTVPDRAISPKANLPDDVPARLTAEANEVTTWHWHVGSKITKRTTVAPGDSRKAE
jgi:hypothetical protein